MSSVNSAFINYSVCGSKEHFEKVLNLLSENAIGLDLIGKFPDDIYLFKNNNTDTSPIATAVAISSLTKNDPNFYVGIYYSKSGPTLVMASVEQSVKEWIQICEKGPETNVVTSSLTDLVFRLNGGDMSEWDSFWG